MTRIAIAGAAGRIGRNLVIACDEAEDLQLTQALEQQGTIGGVEPRRFQISPVPGDG